MLLNHYECPKIIWFYRYFCKNRPVMRSMQTAFSWSIPAVGSICTMASSSLKVKEQKEDDNTRNEKNNKVCTEQTKCKYYEWKPQHIIAEDECDMLNGYACLILNCNIRIPKQIVIRLWQCADIRCTVDGGTNRWYQFLKNLSNQNANLKPPDLITGDFDSILEETRIYFSKNGISQFIHTPNQNATDFTKAVDIIRPIILGKQLHNIIVLHDTSGRLDQIMANLNTLFKPQNAMLNIYLLSGNSLTWLLRPGIHSITIPQNLFAGKHWCSLIPIGEKVHNVTTNGLKWDLHNATLYFSGIVSTSNTYSSSMVTVQTNGNLIWSMGVYSFVDQ